MYRGQLTETNLGGRGDIPVVMISSKNTTNLAKHRVVKCVLEKVFKKSNSKTFKMVNERFGDISIRSFGDIIPEGIDLINYDGRGVIAGKVKHFGDGEVIVRSKNSAGKEESRVKRPKISLRGDEEDIIIHTEKGKDVTFEGRLITAHNSVTIEPGVLVRGKGIVLHGPNAKIGRDVSIDGNRIVIFGSDLRKGSKVYTHAFVGKGAVVGENGIVGPNAVIANGVIIGAESIVGPDAFVADGLEIPGGVYIPKGARIEKQDDVKELKKIEDYGLEKIEKELKKAKEEIKAFEKELQEQKKVFRAKFQGFSKSAARALRTGEECFIHETSKVYASEKEFLSSALHNIGDKCLVAPYVKLAVNKLIVGSKVNFQDFVEIFTDRAFFADRSIVPHHVTTYCKSIEVGVDDKVKEKEAHFMGINTRIIAFDSNVKVGKGIYFDPNVTIYVEPGLDIDLDIPSYANVGPANSTFMIKTKEEAKAFTEMLKNRKRTEDQKAFAEHVLHENAGMLIEGYRAGIKRN